MSGALAGYISKWQRKNLRRLLSKSSRRHFWLSDNWALQVAFGNASWPKGFQTNTSRDFVKFYESDLPWAMLLVLCQAELAMIMRSWVGFLLPPNFFPENLPLITCLRTSQKVFRKNNLICALQIGSKSSVMGYFFKWVTHHASSFITSLVWTGVWWTQKECLNVPKWTL